MISRHSKEQSEAGDGVETVLNEVCQHSVHGQGRKTIKKMHINKYVFTLKICLIFKEFFSNFILKFLNNILFVAANFLNGRKQFVQVYMS